jgi:orotidine-5'-phosphate decarboxylase
MDHSKGVMFAADIPDIKSLLRIVQEVSPWVSAIKLGNAVLLQHGLRLIKEVKQVTDRPVIIDAKIMDIPYVAGTIAEQVLAHGGDGLTVCGPVGYDTLGMCKSILRDKALIVFTQFTHDYSLITDEMANQYVDLAVALDCTGVLVPATLPERIGYVRKRIGDSTIIISCGVGYQGPKVGSAIEQGADYEIIGRAIYSPSDSKTPAEAAANAQRQIIEVVHRMNMGLRRLD